VLTGLADRFLAVVGLVITAPLMALCALGIKRSSPGPVLYRAERAGMNGVPFRMLKLRTMHVGSEHGGRITGSLDARVFRFGAVLRRLKLDELPQLVNVARGEMALVGPRPEDLSIVREHYDALMWETLSVLPGLTSPGSLHYFGDERALPGDPAPSEHVYLERLLRQKTAVDLVYVRNRSRRYDGEILLRTALGLAGLGRLFRRRMEREREAARRLLAEAGPA